MSLLLNRFRGNGLYLLDEPEAALSPKRQLLAVRRIHALVARESQFIISTHSPILLAYPQSKILVLDAKGFHQTEYERTDPYRITRDVLTEPRKYIERLLAADDELSGASD